MSIARKLTAILLVDDDAVNNYLNQRLLARLQVARHVAVAELGERALQALTQPGATVPDLLLLDVNLPGRTGPEFLAAYRRRHPDSPPCVVLLTSTTDPAETARLRQPPVADVVSKPLMVAKLQAVLKRCFADA